MGERGKGREKRRKEREGRKVEEERRDRNNR